MNKVVERLNKSAPVRGVQKYSRKVSVPGFGGHSLYEVARFFFQAIRRGSIQARAAAMSYSFFLALFPTILFFFTLIPYVPIEHFQDTIMDLLKGVMPKNVFDAMQGTLDEIVHRHNGKLLSIGILAALYFSTNGFNSMFGAFNQSIHITETRPWWKQRLIALMMGIILAILVIAGTAMLIGSELAMKHFFKNDHTLQITIMIARWLGLALLTLLVISFFYSLGPAEKIHWRFINPGGILATVLIMGTVALFGWYVNNVAGYNRIYGSLGTVIVVMLFIYYNSMMLLIGFELNASITEADQYHREIELQKEQPN